MLRIAMPRAKRGKRVRATVKRGWSSSSLSESFILLHALSVWGFFQCRSMSYLLCDRSYGCTAPRTACMHSSHAAFSALCEVCGIVAPPSGSEQQPHILIPDLSIELVREWYLSYIDLLQQMCLFSHAAALIGSCSDPAVGALNQQSTTIHESCPSCGKPLDSTATSDKDDGDVKVGLSTQRVCKRCRKQVGLCFLCHQVVKGMYVWCPGCGHGGHLQHALEWFGGTEEQPPQEFCPTGCGHRCNLLQRLRAFPEDAQTASMTCIPIGGGE